jgi:hypothetical protein
MEVINLNLIPSGALPVVHASQYDEGRTFRANLMDGSTVYTLDGTEVLECDVKKPDGNIVTVAVTNTSDSYVEIDTTLQMCACAGDSLAELHITKGAQEIGTLNFILAVERSPLEGGIQSDSGIHNLQTQIGEAVADQYAAEDVVFDAAPVAGHGVGFAVTSEGVKTALDEKANTDDLALVATSGDYNDLDNLPTIPENLPDLGDVEITSPTAGQIIEYDDNDGKWKNVANPASTTNFGAPYDENTTYNVPSLVIYNNLLYKLNDGEDGTTGPWDPTKWTQTSVAELAQLIGSLSTLTTTDKSSIVGAVNEVNANKADKASLASILSPTNRLSSSNDMNSVDVGTYYQADASMPTNAPSSANNAYIIVLSARTSDRVQIWASVNQQKIYYRTCTGFGTSPVWTAWKTITAT